LSDSTDFSIFLSYANLDQARVLPFYEFLVNCGFKAWIDCRNIKVGQNWDFEIKRALEKSSVIVIFVSKNSITRRGYFQREVKTILENYKEKLIDDIYIISILLDDDIGIPDELKGIQVTRASQNDCFTEIKDAINHQIASLGGEIVLAQDRSGVTWTQIT